MSASGSTSQFPSQFQVSLGTTTATSSWLSFYNFYSYFLTDDWRWVWPSWISTDLPAHEKSVHGKLKGHLKQPKLQMPKGHKPKISYNFYHKER
jgi:hypothetical protein